MDLAAIPVVRKMPAPMTIPMTIIVESNRPSPRLNSVSSVVASLVAVGWSESLIRVLATRPWRLGLIENHVEFTVPACHGKRGARA